MIRQWIIWTSLSICIEETESTYSCTHCCVNDDVLITDSLIFSLML